MIEYTVAELEHAISNLKQLKRQPDGSDRCALAAGFRPKINQGGRGGGRNNGRGQAARSAGEQDGRGRQ